MVNKSVPKIVLVMSLMHSFFGCDKITSLLDNDRNNGEEARTVEQEKTDLASAILKVASEKRKTLESHLSERGAALQDLKTDLDSLNKAIATAMNKRLSYGEESKH